MFEDHGSTRIDLACPQCQRLFKVRLRKLQFGADLVCRLCRHEFSARDVSERPEIQEALARMTDSVKPPVSAVKGIGLADLASAGDVTPYPLGERWTERMVEKPG